MSDQIKWGILDTGKIATRFAEALNNIPEYTKFLVVGSRNQDAGDAFGDKCNIPRRYREWNK